MYRCLNGYPIADLTQERRLLVSGTALTHFTSVT